jgi:hypothetical protein
MPRKKTREIKIRHLKCFGAIWEELSGHPGLAGYEITEAVIRVQERVRPTINNVEAVIERIRLTTPPFSFINSNNHGLILSTSPPALRCVNTMAVSGLIPSLTPPIINAVDLFGATAVHSVFVQNQP